MLLTGSQQLSITEFSVPYSVEAESNAELRCRYSLKEGELDKGLYVKWWWTPSNSEDKKQIYQRVVGHDPTIMQHKISKKFKPDLFYCEYLIINIFTI